MNEKRKQCSQSSYQEKETISYELIKNALDKKGYCVVKRVSRSKVSNIKGLLAKNNINTKVVRIVPLKEEIKSRELKNNKYPNSFKIIKVES